VGLTLDQALGEYRAAAEPRLRALLDARIVAMAKPGGYLTPWGEILREYVLRGGKRIRGALCVWAAGAVPAALDASLALELQHAYLLAYDDWMDRDEVRRGGPSLHAACTKALAGDAHRGAAMAILLGALLHEWGYALLAGHPEAMGEMALMLEAVTRGQAIDVLAPEPFPEQDLIEMLALKTARYTIEGPLRIGALVAGHGGEALARLSELGRPLGIAFQIADDLEDGTPRPVVSEARAREIGSRMLEKARVAIGLSPLDGTARERISLLADWIASRIS
jgi:geranylgeranyl diphosphate synthase type I